VPFSGAYSTRRPEIIVYHRGVVRRLGVSTEDRGRADSTRRPKSSLMKGRCPLIGSENRSRRLCAQDRGPEQSEERMAGVQGSARVVGRRLPAPSLLSRLLL
jgi:hypothetical protein